LLIPDTNSSSASEENEAPPPVALELEGDGLLAAEASEASGVDAAVFVVEEKQRREQRTAAAAAQQRNSCGRAARGMGAAETNRRVFALCAGAAIRRSVPAIMFVGRVRHIVAGNAGRVRKVQASTEWKRERRAAEGKYECARGSSRIVFGRV
jgi:hypothetical protein